jgi:hypothetical protein
MHLQNNFSIALGITFLTSFVIVAVMFYRSGLARAEQEAMREARMMLAAATAARSYNSDHVTPLLAARPSDAFAPESVPSFAAQAIMKGFNAAFPEYAYRETALNPMKRPGTGAGMTTELCPHRTAGLSHMVDRRRDFPTFPRLRERWSSHQSLSL